MARPKKATVDYFPHDTSHGKTIYILEERWGNTGYAVFFKTLEIMGANENHVIDCRNPETWEYLLARLKVDDKTATAIYDCLANIQGISKSLWKRRVICSENFIKRVSDVYKRRAVQAPEIDQIKQAFGIKVLCKQKQTSGGVSVCKNKVNVNINPTRKGINTGGNPQSKVNNTKKEISKTLLDSKEIKKLLDLRTIIKGPESRVAVLANEYAWAGESWPDFLDRANREVKQLERKQQGAI